MLNEVRRVHKAEFKVSLWAVDYINEKLGIELPEDEAGFIALHFVNAGYRETTMKSITSTKIIKDILNIINHRSSRSRRTNNTYHHPLRYNLIETVKQ